MPRPDAPTPIPARPSATLLLARDTEAGPQLLMLRRADRGDQNSHAWVFPGGLLDGADRAAHPHCDGLDDAAASERLGLAVGGLDHWVAALRECFEEAGLLLAVDADGGELDPAELAARGDDWRLALQRGERSLAQLCEATGWRLAVDRLHWVAHWVTPLGMPKRFDARFFLARAPQGQEARHDGSEMVDLRWLGVAEALAGATGVQVIGPARALLDQLAGFATVAGMLSWAAQLDPIAPIQPRLGRLGPLEGGRLAPIPPQHPAYPEIGRIDPHGAGHALSHIAPGVAVPLSPDRRVLRVTAPNGSVMTGPGTNSYLLRSGNDCGSGPAEDAGWAVIDPGPDDPAHVQALLAAVPGPIRWILVTHTHIDHSPAARALQAATGAQVFGQRPAHPEWQDTAFAPDRPLAGGEVLEFGPELTLEVIHTPGHAANHLCYRHVQERLLFTGDHVMQGSTVVINPPDGDMAAYLASLRALADRVEGPQGFEWIAPGHGFLIPQPARSLELLIRHRRRREAAVLAALARLGPSPLEALLPVVYHDVPPQRHPVAARSLRAHLLHLQAQQRVVEAQGRWCALP